MSNFVFWISVQVQSVVSFVQVQIKDAKVLQMCWIELWAFMYADMQVGLHVQWLLKLLDLNKN